MKSIDLGEREPTSFLDHKYLGCTQRECKSNESVEEEFTKMVPSFTSASRLTDSDPSEFGWACAAQNREILKVFRDAFKLNAL